MDVRSKQEMVATILLDRLSYAMRGEAELFIGNFERSATKVVHVYDRESAIKFWTTYTYPRNMGGTDMGAVVEQVKREIEGKNFFNLNVDLSEEKTELLLINDGQLA